MKKSILLLFLAISSTIVAQLPRSLLKSAERVTSFDEYDGSMYAKGRYKESSIIDEKSGTYIAKLKYNIYTDAIEFTKDSKLFSIVKTPTTHVQIDSDYFYYCEFKSQRGLKRNGYYILVELNDTYRIYKRLTLDIKEPDLSLIKTSGPGQLKTITTYYLEEEGVIMELPMNKKDILVTFSDKEEELKEYIKKGKIRLRKEEDLVRFVARYNAFKNSDSNISRSLISSNRQ